MNSYKEKLLALRNGTFFVNYKSSKYITTKQTIVDGKIIKLYAKELKGNDIVSGNYFSTIKNGLLKPCEMSDEKVIDFINNLEVID